VLVVSATEFNEATKLPVICPITSGVVRCDQPRVLDLAARKARKVDVVPAAIMAEVLARLGPIFE
jgi:mRNA interferase ChpB